MIVDQTSESMSSIYKNLQRAVSSWEDWKEVSNQLSRQPVGHFEFFDSVQIALLDSVVLAISRVLDRDNRTMSIPNLVKTESRLIDSKSKQRLEGLFLNYKLTFNKIKRRRDQYISHQDRIKCDPNDPLEVVEIDQFIDSLVDSFRELGGFLQSADYDFDNVRESRKRETTKVMAVLQEDWENRSPSNRWSRTG